MKQGLKEIAVFYVALIACMSYALKALSEIVKEANQND